MTAEVGVIKRDIAYHSDVLNTAARIQGLCNKYGADVLVTKAIVEGLPETCDLEYIPMGSIRLKGKNVENEIFDIKRPPNSL